MCLYFRSRNGWINNPNCLQFIRTYKRLLLHQDVRSNTGNCIAQDQTSILTVTSTKRPLEMTEINFSRRTDKVVEEIKTKINIFLPIQLNEFSENVISYISGFVVKVVQKEIKCSTCIEALRFSEDIDESDTTLKLISRKSNGGLILPSLSVREVCKRTEKKIQIISKILEHLPPKDTFMNLLLKDSESLLFNENIFISLNNHVYDYAIDEVLHKKKLITAIIKCYGAIRINSIIKKINDDISGEKIRKTLNKLILFKHQ